MTNFQQKTIAKAISDDILKKGFLLDKEGLSSWLKQKNLLHEKDDLISFEDLTPWSRTGGETYSTTFTYSTVKEKYELIAKAIVTTNPEKSLSDWAKRRQLLSANGIPVANWLWTGEATIIEPFYPKTYKEVANFETLIKIAFTLDKLGFTTLKFLDDIRCDSRGNPFYIDFGFDLGEPSENNKKVAKEYLLKQCADKAGLIESYFRSN